MKTRYYIASALENAEQVRALKKILDDSGETCAFYHHSLVQQCPSWNSLLFALGVG